MFDVRKYSRSRPLQVALSLILVWTVSAWFIAESSYRSDIDELIAQETLNSQNHADDLADSIRRNLNYLSGIPALLSAMPRVQQPIVRFASDVPSKLALEQRRKKWTEDPALSELNRFLVHAKNSLNVDLIYVANAAGDAIAASNGDTKGSSIGTNYAERDYFAMNKKGLRGMQYAMGKTTHIPGLFFSSPVVSNGKFMGAVVAKVDVPNLSYLTTQLNAFVVDGNGVIILAHDKSLEMRAVPGAAIFSEIEREKREHYLRTDFQELKMEPWGDARFSGMLRIDNGSTPYLRARADIPEFGLGVYVMDELDSFSALSRERFWFAMLLGALGSALIMLASGVAFYLQSLKKSKAVLWNQANFDALTGLPNRAMFQDRLAQELKKADRSGQALALMLIDLDRFKEVNDTLGHAMGDLLLQEAAMRMVDCVRESDTVARLGGDEFTVVLPQMNDPKHAEEVARKIVAALALPFMLHGHEAHVSASLGIALYPQDAVDIDHLIRNADQAMYAAKNSGRNNFSYFQSPS